MRVLRGTLYCWCFIFLPFLALSIGSQCMSLRAYVPRLCTTSCPFSLPVLVLGHELGQCECGRRVRRIHHLIILRKVRSVLFIHSDSGSWPSSSALVEL
ncbi:hypothetical protein BD414DRAFT_489368 [Trametes punicea]|nr:hypothetical protein BD414DRAFT_489368 [Trametes punicea]